MIVLPYISFSEIDLILDTTANSDIILMNKELVFSDTRWDILELKKEVTTVIKPNENLYKATQNVIHKRISSDGMYAEFIWICFRTSKSVLIKDSWFRRSRNRAHHKDQSKIITVAVTNGPPRFRLRLMSQNKSSKKTKISIFTCDVKKRPKPRPYPFKMHDENCFFFQVLRIERCLHTLQ